MFSFGTQFRRYFDTPYLDLWRLRAFAEIARISLMISSSLTVQQGGLPRHCGAAAVVGIVVGICGALFLRQTAPS